MSASGKVSQGQQTASISVIVPTQNRPALLEEAVQSLLAQTQPPAEIVIVDDGSTPPVNGDHLAAKFGHRIRVVRNETARGLAYSRNLGVETTHCEFITHLDDDDLLAPEALYVAYRAFIDDPSLELAFLGAVGFGPHSEYFNRVQPEAIERVIEAAGGQRSASRLVTFDRNLIKGLLRSVPIAFQRVMLRRETWQRISALRLRAYRLDPKISDDAAAKNSIVGPLRDSEWALYASAACQKTALVDQPLYLQRCAGQGYSSQPNRLEQHLQQGLIIKSALYRATEKLPELLAWHKIILDSVAAAHFDAAYHYFETGNRAVSMRELLQALNLKPSLAYARFAFRMWLPRW